LVSGQVSVKRAVDAGQWAKHASVGLKRATRVLC